MFFPESDINSWKEDLKARDVQRKNAQQDTSKIQFTKPVTWRDVKQKEVEYHPILQKFAHEEKESNEKVKEINAWKHRSEVQKKNLEKYLPEYNIINLEKDLTVPTKEDLVKTKTRLLPAAQVDYNIITNNKLDDFHFQNVKLNVDSKKKDNRKANNGNKREFNIVSNRYFVDHDEKSEVDHKRVEQDLKNKYDRTHDYNPIVAQYYDSTKESHYQEKKAKEQQEHGKHQIDKLPPTIKNRETIIFDPTREVPEAIKMLDQKKKEAMKKYELRYKVEEQIKTRDFEQQDKVEQMKLQRINDKKFTEHLDKGFDIITMNDYDKSQLKYVAKPAQTKWEKLRITSNNALQVQQPSKTPVEKQVSLTSSDLKQGRESSGRVTTILGLKDTVRSASVMGSDLLRIGSRFQDTNDFTQAKDLKNAYQRAKEPVYNLADQYNQYCVPPKRVIDDFNTRTLPQIKIADNSLKFGLTKTGGFKRLEMTTYA